MSWDDLESEETSGRSAIQGEFERDSGEEVSSVMCTWRDQPKRTRLWEYEYENCNPRVEKSGKIWHEGKEGGDEAGNRVEKQREEGREGEDENSGGKVRMITEEGSE
ncbi:hypothetical protein Pcinc_028440 [Petrolisthes cinctipes]|uniref:Uncharacterized protein n=1 Tax=Petrolisthes cinctipes TaxID=88211 RepID=A0AAE1K8W8_PETCI|nr:hypothetical protein Pcinc_028440 [Petrolisthes cinctipes]